MPVFSVDRQILNGCSFLWFSTGSQCLRLTPGNTSTPRPLQANAQACRTLCCQAVVYWKRPRDQAEALQRYSEKVDSAAAREIWAHCFLFLLPNNASPLPDDASFKLAPSGAIKCFYFHFDERHFWKALSRWFQSTPFLCPQDEISPQPHCFFPHHSILWNAKCNSMPRLFVVSINLCGSAKSTATSKASAATTTTHPVYIL